MGSPCQRINSFLGFPSNEYSWNPQPELCSPQSSILFLSSAFSLTEPRRWNDLLPWSRASLCWSPSEPFQLVFPAKEHPQAPVRVVADSSQATPTSLCSHAAWHTQECDLGALPGRSATTRVLAFVCVKGPDPTLQQSVGGESGSPVPPGFQGSEVF